MTQKRYWIAVADLDKTRVFEFTPRKVGLNFVTTITNESSDEELRQKGSASKSTSDGHRALTNEASIKRRMTEGYINNVCSMIGLARKEGAFSGLFLVAGPDTLGLLRQHLDKETLRLVESEIGKDFARFSPQDIYAHLQGELENPALSI
jgi:protein required for attachment to host cells